HAQRGVGLFADIGRIERLEVAGPAATGIELGVGGEQRGAAAHTTVNAMLAGVPIASGERALGAFLALDRVFFRRQFRTPLGVDLFNLVHVYTFRKTGLL